MVEKGGLYAKFNAGKARLGNSQARDPAGGQWMPDVELNGKRKAEEISERERATATLRMRQESRLQDRTHTHCVLRSALGYTIHYTQAIDLYNSASLTVELSKSQ